MQPRSPESNSFRKNIRYALLVLVFCVLNTVELVHAKFALLTLSELHAYWMGQNGHFPFTALPWSERHFGGDTLAMRLPLLVIFAVLLAVVLLGLNRLIKRCGPATLTVGTLVLLAVLTVEQYFALRGIQRERREFSLLMNRVERVAAPGETVVADWNLVLPLYAYGSDALRLQLRSTLHSFPDMPPVAPYEGGALHEEMIYVGSAKDPFAQRQFAARRFQFREDEMAPAAETASVASYYRAQETGIYFVSPLTVSSAVSDVNPAVSSKP